MQYAADHGIEVEATRKSIFSTDQNLWGRSIEAGILEDPWVEPPPETFQWTVDPREAPDEPEVVEIEFDRGRPVALERPDHSRRSRADRGAQPDRRPSRRRAGSTTSRTDWSGSSRARSTRPPPRSCSTRPIARSEFLTLSKDALRFKTQVSQQYSDLIYNGLWFSALHQDLMAIVVSNQQYVSGVARVKLFKGHAMIVGRKSENSLYRHELATYEEGDQYDSSAAQGFIKIHGLSQTTQAKHQMLKGTGGRPARAAQHHPARREDLTDLARQFEEVRWMDTNVIEGEALAERVRAAAESANNKDEVWDGVYIVSPGAIDEHEEIALNLGTIFTLVLGRTRLGWVRSDTNVSDREVQWEHNFRCPDVVVYLKGTKARNDGTHWVGSPDFAVEVVSKADRSRQKLDFYAKVSTRELLMIDREPWSLGTLPARRRRPEAGRQVDPRSSRHLDQRRTAPELSPR